MGMSGYYHSFVLHFSEVTSPSLKRSARSGPVDGAIQMGLLSGKSCLWVGKLLHSPGFSVLIVLQTDVPDMELWSLSQIVVGEECLVLYII